MLNDLRGYNPHFIRRKGMTTLRNERISPEG
jgi:hypothetical protein